MSGRLRLAAQVAAVGVVAALLALLAWKLTQGESEVTSQLGRGGTPAAPQFVLERLDRKGELSLRSLRGKAVVLNFWATWCGPCRQEFPELQKVAAGMSNDVVVLALDQAESAGKVAQYRDEFQATFTILLDARTQVADAYRLSGIPDTIFIDKNGVVRDVVFGPLSAGTFRYKISQALAAP